MAYPTLSEILGQADPVTGALSPELERLLTEAFQPEQPQQMYAPPQVTGRQRGFALASDIAAALAQAYRVPTPIDATLGLYQREQARQYAQAENARRTAEAGTASKRARALEMLQMLQREREIQGAAAEKPAPRDLAREKTVQEAKAFGLAGLVGDILSSRVTPEQANVAIADEQHRRDVQEAADKAKKEAKDAAEEAQKRADREAEKAKQEGTDKTSIRQAADRRRETQYKIETGIRDIARRMTVAPNGTVTIKSADPKVPDQVMTVSDLEEEMGSDIRAGELLPEQVKMLWAMFERHILTKVRGAQALGNLGQ